MLRMDRDAAIDLLRDTKRYADAADGAAARNDLDAASAYAQAAIAQAVSALAVAVVIHADKSSSV